MTTITNSPWGTPDTVQEIGEGVSLVLTPSHGGYHVDADHLDTIPLAWREASFNRQGMHGWFEEDVDAIMVVLAFPHLFLPAERQQARHVFQYWLAPKLTAVALRQFETMEIGR